MKSGLPNTETTSRLQKSATSLGNRMLQNVALLPTPEQWENRSQDFSPTDGKKKTSEYLPFIKDCLQLIQYYIQGRYRYIPLKSLLILIGIIAYVCIPEPTDAIPVLGWCDEVLLLNFLAKSLQGDIERFRLFRDSAIGFFDVDKYGVDITNNDNLKYRIKGATATVKSKETDVTGTYNVLVGDTRIIFYDLNQIPLYVNKKSKKDQKEVS